MAARSHWQPILRDRLTRAAGKVCRHAEWNCHLGTMKLTIPSDPADKVSFGVTSVL